mmetsp:Transcript_5150/g.15234  ORF Transcript_5150/g.15234 Transcript_5150/m.15234 type:complete len:210 (-) Transcript_5150:1274-1903(-)
MCFCAWTLPGTSMMGLLSYAYENYNLVGLLPTELGAQTALNRVDLWGVNRYAPIPLPTEIGRFSSLTWLDLRAAKYTSSIPTELGRLTSVFQINLAQNLFEGPLPTEIGHLTAAASWPAYLLPSVNESIPTEMGHMSRLTNLNMNSNDLSGQLPTELGALTSLSLVYVRCSALSAWSRPLLQHKDGLDTSHPPPVSRVHSFIATCRTTA